MHIKEYLIEREIPFTVEDGHVTVTSEESMWLESLRISDMSDTTLEVLGNHIDLYDNHIESFDNTTIKCRILDLSPMRHLTNLNGLTFEGRHIVISRTLTGRAYIQLFTNATSHFARGR